MKWRIWWQALKGSFFRFFLKWIIGLGCAFAASRWISVDNGRLQLDLGLYIAGAVGLLFLWVASDGWDEYRRLSPPKKPKKKGKSGPKAKQSN